MALGDLSVIGPQFTVKRRIAASTTRYEVGEPLYQDGTTLSSGAVSANTVELMDADGVVLGTDTFSGVAIKRCLPLDSGTVTAHETMTANPIPETGLIRGKAETSGNVDTDAELLLIEGDVTLIDYNSTGATDGGELYTIKDTASADTSAFTIRDGNIVKGTLDVSIDVRGYRTANDITT